MHCFGYSPLVHVLTTLHPTKMQLKCKELFHRYLTPPHDAQKNAALLGEGHLRLYQSFYC